MKLSFASAYAVSALVHLAAGKEDRITASHVIAAAEGFPEPFLQRVLHRLVSARVLLGAKGPNRGYRLARPADKITLLEVIEAEDGPMQGMVPEADRGKLDAQLQEVCDRAAELVRQRLRKVTVRELAGKGK